MPPQDGGGGVYTPEQTEAGECRQAVAGAETRRTITTAYGRHSEHQQGGMTGAKLAAMWKPGRRHGRSALQQPRTVDQWSRNTEAAQAEGGTAGEVVTDGRWGRGPGGRRARLARRAARAKR